MKQKHTAGWITAALVIIIGAMSFPYAWFHIKTEEFLECELNTSWDIQVEIRALQKDAKVQLETQRDKNVVLSALKREVEYEGPLFYRLPMQLKGAHEIYEVWVRDFDNHVSWLFYIGDDKDYNYLRCGDNFNAGLVVSEELLEILDEYTETVDTTINNFIEYKERNI